MGPTRTEEDALAHLQRLVESDPRATKWHVVLDNLNTHQSEVLGRWVADLEGIEQDTLGVKGKSGILRSMTSRAAFLLSNKFMNSTIALATRKRSISSSKMDV